MSGIYEGGGEFESDGQIGERVVRAEYAKSRDFLERRILCRASNRLEKPKCKSGKSELFCVVEIWVSSPWRNDRSDVV